MKLTYTYFRWLSFLILWILCINAKSTNDTSSTSTSTNPPPVQHEVVISMETFQILIGISVAIVLCCGCVLLCFCVGICYHYNYKSPKIIQEIEIPQRTLSKQSLHSRSRVSMARDSKYDQSDDNMIIDGIDDMGTSPSPSSPYDINEDIETGHKSTGDLTNSIQTKSTIELSDRHKHQKQKHRKKSSKSVPRKKSKAKKQKKYKKNMNDDTQSTKSSNLTINLSSSSSSKQITTTTTTTTDDEMHKFQLSLHAEGDSGKPSETKEDNDHRLKIFANKQRKATAGGDINDDDDINDIYDGAEHETQNKYKKARGDKDKNARFNSEELYVDVINSASNTPFGATKNNPTDHGKNILLQQIEDMAQSMTPQQNGKIDDIKHDDDDNEEHSRSHSASTLTLNTIETVNMTPDGNETSLSNGNKNGGKGIPMISPTTTTNTIHPISNVSSPISNDNDDINDIYDGAEHETQNKDNQYHQQQQRTLSGPEGGRIIHELELYDDELALEESKQPNFEQINNTLNLSKDIGDNVSESQYTMDGYRRNTMLTERTALSEGDKGTKANLNKLKEHISEYTIHENLIPDIREQHDFDFEDDQKSIHHETMKKHYDKKLKKKSKRDKKDKKDKKRKDRKDRKHKKHKKKKKKDRKDKSEKINENKLNSSDDTEYDDDEDVLIGIDINTPIGPSSHVPRNQAFSATLPNHDKINGLLMNDNQKAQSYDKSDHRSPFHQTGASHYHTQPNLKYFPVGPPPQFNMMNNNMNINMNMNMMPVPAQKPISPFIVDDKNHNDNNNNSNDNGDNNDNIEVQAPPRFVRPNKT